MSEVQFQGLRGVELTLSWIPASNGEVPPGAVKAGDDCYIARARHNGEWIPGKLPIGHTSAYVAYDNREHSYSDYEVLVSTDMGRFGEPYEWKSAKGVEPLPKHALIAGFDNGAPLFVARAMVEGEMCAGKAYPPHLCAYFPWGTLEHRMEKFEVLVLNKNFA